MTQDPHQTARSRAQTGAGSSRVKHARSLAARDACKDPQTGLTPQEYLFAMEYAHNGNNQSAAALKAFGTHLSPSAANERGAAMLMRPAVVEAIGYAAADVWAQIRALVPHLLAVHARCAEREDKVGYLCRKDLLDRAGYRESPPPQVQISVQLSASWRPEGSPLTARADVIDVTPERAALSAVNPDNSISSGDGA